MSGETAERDKPTTRPDTPSGVGKRAAARVWRATRAVLITLALTLAVLIVLEGVSGAVLFTLDSLQADRQDTAPQTSKLDAELGWALLPNVEIPALWGPGRRLHTNGQAFRSDYEILLQEPPGRARLICSGDSFTFGEGVANEDAWCQLLASIDPRLEAVNLGQPGYGVGQAFLWFMRSTETIEHSFHILAFITLDFNRMRRSSFRLWEKPKLVVRDGELVIANYPVDRNQRLMSWLEARRKMGKRFNVWRLVKRIEASLEAEERESTADANDDAAQGRDVVPPLPDSASRAVAAAIFSRLTERNRAKGSTLVLVHLPGMADLEAGARIPLYRSWDRFLTEQAAQHDYLYIDLVPELAALSEDEQWRLFIAQDFEGYRGAAGHYSAYGNALVARVLYDRLIQIPAIRERLAALPPPDVE